MTALNYLAQAEGRLASLLLNSPDSPEVARFRDVIIPDLTSKLTADDIKAREAGKAAKTPAQLKAEREAEEKAMEANRDRPSI